MNSRIAKTFAAIASLLAVFTVRGDLTYSTPQEVTFDSMNTSPGAVGVGASDAATFAENWCVWKTMDGTENCGFTGASKFQVGSTDISGVTYGRLKIESGYYSANVNHKNLIGYKGTGYVWVTGGFLDITNNLYVGVGNPGLGYLNIDGGKVATSTDLSIGQDANDEGHVSVTNAELTVGSALYVGHGSNSKATLAVGGPASSITVGGVFAVAEAASSTSTVSIAGGTLSISGEFRLANNANANAQMTISNATVTAAGWVCIGRNGANKTGILTVEKDGKFIHTNSSSTDKLFGIGNLAGDNSRNELIIKDGGYVSTYSDVRMGESGSAILTIHEGGVFRAATASGGARYIIINQSSSNPYTSTINLNGGTIETGRITTGGGANSTAQFNFNGGTLRAVAAETLIANQSDLTVTVNEAGGTIDTAGYNVTIAKTIGGTGTLTITGGGTVTFSANPTCAIKVTDGTIVKFADGIRPSSIVLGAGDFIEYDLSSVTESGVTTNLDENVTITVPEGDEVGEHVIIKNGGVFWNVTYSGNTLTATSTSDTTALTDGYTIWTGYGDNSNGNDIKSWVNGYPSATTRVIVPFTCSMRTLDSISVGELVLHGDLTLYSSNNRWKNIRPRSVTGDGTIYLGFANSFGYFESHLDSEATEVNVPVIAHANTPVVTGSSTSPLNFNKSFTINSGVIVDHNSPNNNVNYNDDLIVNGTLKLHGKVPVLQKAIGGAGEIQGSFTTAEGATLYATVTNANATAECLTVTGTADLANATVEISGGELVADAAYGTKIVLLKANSISNWTKMSYVIPGQSKSWKIKKGNVVTVGEAEYETLVAEKSSSGFVIIVQ